MTTPSDKVYNASERARAAQRKYHATHRDLRNAKSRRYYQTNRESILSQKATYRDANRERSRAYSRQYRIANRTQVLKTMRETGRAYREDHRQKLKQRAREYREANKAAIAARRKLWEVQNRDRHAATQRRTSLKRIYRLTTEEWHALLEKQGGKCPICKTDDPGGRNWHTDHDHATGKIRGILCGRCNIMLGHARDSVEILLAAIAYLKA
jgi:hypothetical protein